MLIFYFLKGVVAIADVVEACTVDNVAVLVVANPENTNCLNPEGFAPSIPEKSISLKV